jgi:hypothetical protein
VSETIAVVFQSDAKIDIGRCWEDSMEALEPGRYRHYKGNDYTVLGVARHSETGETLVVYRQEYGDYGWWVRPQAMFMETVEVDGRIVPRFSPLGAG